MKKNIKLFIVIITIIIATSLIYILIRNKENQNELFEDEEIDFDYELVPAEADDEFSERIINTVSDVFIYRGRVDIDEMTYYEFVYDYNVTEEDVVIFSQAITENSNLVKGKTEILVGLSSGSQQIWAFTLDNTSDESLKQPDYDGFYRLRTYNWLFVDSPSYLQLISSIEGIRKLEATESFMNDSEKYDIDWYEVWPDLEEVVIYETGE